MKKPYRGFYADLPRIKHQEAPDRCASWLSRNSRLKAQFPQIAGPPWLGAGLLLLGDKAKARIAYQDFLALWKDADPEIPILQQAQAEYQGLQ